MHCRNGQAVSRSPLRAASRTQGSPASRAAIRARARVASPSVRSPSAIAAWNRTRTRRVVGQGDQVASRSRSAAGEPGGGLAGRSASGSWRAAAELRVVERAEAVERPEGVDPPERARAPCRDDQGGDGRRVPPLDEQPLRRVATPAVRVGRARRRGRPSRPRPAEVPSPRPTRRAGDPPDPAPVVPPAEVDRRRAGRPGRTAGARPSRGRSRRRRGPRRGRSPG